MTQGPDEQQPGRPGDEPAPWDQPAAGDQPHGQQPYPEQPPARPAPGEQPWGQQPYPGQSYPDPSGQQSYGEQPYGQPYPGQQGWGAPQQYNPAYGGAYGVPGAGPDAPYGRHPVTGVPYSDKQKLVAGLLQVLVPLGIGRFYMGDTGVGVAQLLVTVFTCGIGAIWPFVDGILILAGDKTDSMGRPLRG